MVELLYRTGFQSALYPRPNEENFKTSRTRSIYLKLYTAGVVDGKELKGTKFYGLDGAEIEWEDLVNMDFSIRPDITHAKIYCGGSSVRPQHFLTRAIVYPDITPKKEENFTKIEAEEILAANPALMEEFQRAKAEMAARKAAGNRPTLFTAKPVEKKISSSSSDGQNTESSNINFVLNAT